MKMIFIILLVNFCFMSKFYVVGKNNAGHDGCVEPPMKCPNENITFWLYTRKNENNSHQVEASKPETIKSAPWVKDAPIKIIIHGYTGHKDFAPNVELRPAYMKCCDYNLISVDYKPIARQPCYTQSVRNTELVGMCTAQLIDALVKEHDFRLDKFHVIGFSLGGQTAGYVGNYVQSGRIERLTGLDPALPLFATLNPNKKIDKTDGKFVDILHTNALQNGKLEASGHIDFYANGGMFQPGCEVSHNPITMSTCNHNRAPTLYAESLNTEIGFYGTKCFSWITYTIGLCEWVHRSEQVLFGEYVPRDASGIYFFTTNSEPPYARGQNENKQNSTTS